MAVAVRAWGSGDNAGGGTTLVVNLPAGRAVGDILVLSVDVRGGTGTTITLPQNSAAEVYTLLDRTNSTTVLAKATYWKVATAADVTDTTVTITITSNKASGVIVAIQQGSATAPAAGQHSISNNASSATVTLATLGSWTSGNVVDLAFAGTAIGTTWTSGPTSYTFGVQDASTGASAGTRTTSVGSSRALTGVTTVGALSEVEAAAAVNIGHHVAILQGPVLGTLAVAGAGTVGLAGTKTSAGSLGVAGSGLIGLAGSLAMTGYPGVVMADNPGAYWRLGEPSGTVANDVTGAHNGAYVNTPTLGVAGAIGGDSDTAVHFTAAQSEYVNVPGYVDAPPLISIEAWINSEGNAQNDVGIAGWIEAAVYACLAWYDNSDRLQFAIGSSVMDITGLGGTLAAAGWHHVVGTHDGTSARLYLDGTLIGGPTAATYTGITGALATFKIGQYGALQGTYGTWSGDEVAVYGYALSATQVAAHYAAGAGGVTRQGTLAVAGAGTIGLAGSLVEAGSLAVTGAATVVRAGTLVEAGSLGTLGTGVLGLAGGLVTNASLAVTGSGLISGSPRMVYAGGIGVIGSGLVGWVDVLTLGGAWSRTGSGLVGLTPTALYAGSWSQAAAGSLGQAQLLLLGGVWSSTGTGLVGLVGSTVGGGAVQGTLAVVGSGALGAAPGILTSGSLQVAGAGLYGAAGSLALGGIHTLTGTGLVAWVDVLRFGGSLGIAGAGFLGVTGTITGHQDGTLGLSGAGTFAPVGSLVLSSGLSMSGAGLLGGSGSLLLPGGAAWVGVGSLGQAGSTVRLLSLALNGAGSFALSGFLVLPGSLSLTGTGLFEATAVSGFAPGAHAGVSGSGSSAVVTGGHIGASVVATIHQGEIVTPVPGATALVSGAHNAAEVTR